MTHAHTETRCVDNRGNMCSPLDTTFLSLWLLILYSQEWEIMPIDRRARGVASRLYCCAEGGHRRLVSPEGISSPRGFGVSHAEQTDCCLDASPSPSELGRSLEAVFRCLNLPVGWVLPCQWRSVAAR